MAALELRCSVKSFKMLTPTVYELTFDSEPGFEFEAGQFISCVIPGAGPKGRDLRRAYSIASAPEVRPVELCVKLVDGGPGSNYLGQLRAGDTFKGFAPYGDFTYQGKDVPHDLRKHAVFVSTGTGIAPFRAMVMSDTYKKFPPPSAVCLLGVRTQDELLYQKDFSDSPIKWVETVSQPTPGWNGTRGRVTDYMRTLGEDFPWLKTDFYLCGNGEMIKEIKALLTEKGVQKESIHQEKYY
jgi:ferredoxin-NADP reductase